MSLNLEPKAIAPATPLTSSESRDCLVGADGPSEAFTKALERLTGETISQLRKIPMDVRRYQTEGTGTLMHFISRFPFIGRGNVMRDRLIDHEAVEALLDKALR